jgi:hypothetical protein
MVDKNLFLSNSRLSPYFLKESRFLLGHRLQKQSAIEKQVPDFAARFSDQQASMACDAMGCPVPAAVVRLMISADGIIGANPQAL